MIPKIIFKYVYRFKLTTNFYGPDTMRIEKLSVVASNYDDALEFIHNLHKSKDNLYCIELLDKTECVYL